MAWAEEAEERTGLTCSICESGFDIEIEGEIVSFFGIRSVAFCTWCYASIVYMVSLGCSRCIEDEIPVVKN